MPVTKASNIIALKTTASSASLTVSSEKPRSHPWLTSTTSFPIFSPDCRFKVVSAAPKWALGPCLSLFTCKFDCYRNSLNHIRPFNLLPTRCRAC